MLDESLPIEWARCTAAVLYEKMESINNEAEQEAQIRQDADAGQWVWIEEVAKVLVAEIKKGQ